MKLNGFKLLTGENVHPAVVRFLAEEGFDIRDVKEDGLVGTPGRLSGDAKHMYGDVGIVVEGAAPPILVRANSRSPLQLNRST